MKVTYRDVKTDILSKITKGEWPLGSLVPNEVDLAETYGCARATVNRAMRELADEGFIERRRKAGTRVRMAPVRQARFDIPLVRAEIWKCLEALKAEGLAILVIDKNLNALMRIGDWHYIMEKGRIAWSGTSPELLGDKRVMDRFLGV